MQTSKELIKFNKACKKMYDYYISLGFLGINSAVDTGNEWAFLQEDSIENPCGNRPIFVDKENGSMRVCDYFNDNDYSSLISAQILQVPRQYMAK